MGDESRSARGYVPIMVSAAGGAGGTSTSEDYWSETHTESLYPAG